MASARDMAGLGATGSGVPHYNIYGHQHNREPFKDKTHLLKEDVRHHRWLDPAPQIRSRTELQQARKRGRVPDATNDFDGDGVVGQLDYFVGRSFDKNNDGRLTPGEKRQAKEALASGFLDKYMRGIDSQGDAGRPYSLKQTRGVILSADNPQDVSNLTYQRHHNAHHNPPHSTKTALELHRWGELKAAGCSVGEKYISNNAYVQEPAPPHHETHPRTCPISHIRERAEADHQLSRVRAGLLPMNGHVNPERDSKTVGLGYQQEPFVKTRGQLLETRREAMKRHCEDLRAKGDELNVPLSVRRAEKEAREFEFRRPSCEGEPKTLTQLKDDRKRDRIEYDMKHFQNQLVAPREYPRYSDRGDVPFWIADSAEWHGNPDKLAAAAPASHMVPSVSEPVLKVTEQQFGHDLRDSRADLPEAAFTVAAGLAAATKSEGRAADRFGSNTVKRFTADCIDRGEGRNMPRLFDAIQPVTVGPMDLQSLELTSSMEPIRLRAQQERREEQRKNALNPRRSRLWYETQQAQQSSVLPTQSTGSAVPRGSVDGSVSAVDTSADRVDRNRSTNAGRSRVNTERVMQTAASEPALRVATGTMPEREPKFYGHASDSTVRPSATGVRCGGFQRLDWPPRQSRPQQPQQQQRDRSNTQHRDRSMNKSDGRTNAVSHD